MTVIGLVGVMILLGKTLLRMPISVSGHAGVLWIAALMIGRGVVRRPWSATLMALIGGLLVAMIQPSDSGMLFTVAKYVIPGIILDIVAVLVNSRLDLLLPAVAAGALAHSGKVVVDLVQGVIAGVPASILAVGLTASTALHIAFGALGGLLGALVLRAMIKARVPQLDEFADQGGAL
jgi:hypothetical protein